jgi:cell division protein FtsI/penicillin-binding protein 2
MKRRNIVASAIVAAVLAAGIVGFVIHQGQARLDREARASADRFASAWSHRDVHALTYVGQPADRVAASFKTTTQGLGSAPVKVSVTSLTRDGDKAGAKLSVAWTVAGGVTWKYPMTVDLQHNRAGAWAVVTRNGATMWAPGVRAGSKLVAQRTSGTRGEILDRNGVALASVGKVRDVTIDTARASEQTVREVAALIPEVDANALVGKYRAAKAAGSVAGIPVISLRAARFDAIMPQLEALIGVVYPSREQPLATLARPLLGSYGPVTAEGIKKGKGKYVAGDYAGTSGLQGQYNKVLGGTPGVKVTASDAPTKPLMEKAAVNGKPMTLTLDTKVQKAAEDALTRTGAVPSALVSVDIASGELLAVADSPTYGTDRALVNHYAPGSTLKVATTYSLLTHGLSPETPVSCPGTLVVEGFTTKNFQDEAFGPVPFSKDFAESCNNAFVTLSAKMGDSDVRDAATALGIGAGWAEHLGVAEAFDGSVPVSKGRLQRANTAFGQAQTSVSPAALAVMTSSVARGSYVQPALIRTPTVPTADRTPKPLDDKAAGELRKLMRLVVTEGTGKSINGVSGGPVSGKTGTAEYGSGTPPKTHAWFVGWQGNVAFAVLVEDGKSGGSVAVPVAKAFLQNLHQ